MAQGLEDEGEMKKVVWIKEGDPIPDNAKYLNEHKTVVTQWGSDHDLLPPHAEKYYEIFLYEIQIEEPK